MAIVKEDNFYTAIYEENNYRIWAKLADNKSLVDGEEYVVVTAITITKGDNKEVIYKLNLGNNWLKYDNLCNMAENLLYYIVNTETVEFFKNKFMQNCLLKNDSINLEITVRRLKKEINDKQEMENNALIHAENKELLEQIKAIAENKNLKFYNLYSSILFVELERYLDPNYILDLNRKDELESTLNKYNVKYKIYNSDSYKGYKYVHEADNQMYKDIIKELQNNQFKID